MLLSRVMSITKDILPKVKEIIWSFYLKVKDTFSKLHPLPGVWNSVVKATLCQPQHLKHRDTISMLIILISQLLIALKGILCRTLRKMIKRLSLNQLQPSREVCEIGTHSRATKLHCCFLLGFFCASVFHLLRSFAVCVFVWLSNLTQVCADVFISALERNCHETIRK